MLCVLKRSVRIARIGALASSSLLHGYGQSCHARWPRANIGS